MALTSLVIVADDTLPAIWPATYTAKNFYKTRCLNGKPTKYVYSCMLLWFAVHTFLSFFRLWICCWSCSADVSLRFRDIHTEKLVIPQAPLQVAQLILKHMFGRVRMTWGIYELELEMKTFCWVTCLCRERQQFYLFIFSNAPNHLCPLAFYVACVVEIEF